MECENEEEIEEKIKHYSEQVELLKRKLEQKKRDKSVSAQTELDKQEPSTSYEDIAKTFSPSASQSLVKEQLKDQSGRFATYKKRPGTKDQGREFEQTLCGFYALKLVNNQEVQDFEMTSNNDDDGIFDDIGLTVRFVNGSSRKFLFQLKHKESKNINLSDLQSQGKNNPFNLKKYVKCISEMNLSEDTVVFLSTNSSTKLKGNISLTEDIMLEQCNRIEFEEFLLNTKEGCEDAIFEVKSENLKQKFYLCTSQMNVDTTAREAKRFLRNLVQCDIYGSFESYMRYWWNGRHILMKHDVVAKISELAFTPFLKPLTNQKCNEKTENLRRAFMDFPLTIVEDCDEEIVENIWKIEESWMDEDFSKARNKYGLTEQQKNVTLWYLGKLPLVVRVDRSNEVLIKHVMNFLRKDIRDKKIVLSGQASRDDFEKWDTLGSLSDVARKCSNKQYFSDILRNFKVSLQERGCLNLENLINLDADLANLIGTTQLLKMSQLDYLLVGNTKKQSLKLYISRTISPVFVKTEDILQTHRSAHDTFLIFNCDEEFSIKLSEERTINTMESLQYISSGESKNQSNLILLSTRSKCTIIQFEAICEKSAKRNVFLLQQFDANNCILILRKGNKLKFEYRDTTKLVKESEILKYFDNPLHVFCAPPGMGKSALMTFLYNNCPSDSLAVYVNLISCNAFPAEEPNEERIFARFLGIDGTRKDLFVQLKKQFWLKRRLYMFLDGLDEVNGRYVKHVLHFIKHVSSQGGHVWLSSRENLQEEICRTLHVVPIEIKELNEDEQKRYIHSKLEGSYDNGQIEKITTATFRSSDLNNSRNLLGIPLQLHMITEMFVHDVQAYEQLENENCFVLTKMYKTFFQGKVKWSSNKLLEKNQEHQLGYLNYVLQAYEVPALKACLDSEEYKRLQIDETEVEDFLKTLKREGDKLGIIKTITADGQAMFNHQTYAEYFASVFFKKNPNKMKLLRDEIFDKRYENFRKIFDIMLAENNPLHLAVIYEDVDRVEHLIGKVDYEDAEMLENLRILVNSADAGGRTAFDLAFSDGHKYPPFLEINNLFLLDFRTLERVNRDKRDYLFNLDCASYAIKSKCLYCLEKLLENNLLTFQELKESFKICGDIFLTHCCAQFGYPNLLYGLIKQDPSLLYNGNYFLPIAMLDSDADRHTPLKKGNMQCVKLLLREAIHLNCPQENGLKEIYKRSRFEQLKVLENYNVENKIFSHLKRYCAEVESVIQELEHNVNARNDLGRSLLHRATELGNFNILEYLCSKDNLDVNARDLQGITALHLACQRGSSSIVNMLLMTGADKDLTDNRKNNSLHYASMTRFLNEAVVEILIDRGISVDKENEQGQTPLHLACQHSNIDNVRLLREQGANPQLKDKYNNNALHHATISRSSSEDIIRMLIDEGVSVNEENKQGQTPLHLACQRYNIHNVKILLEQGANPQLKDKENNNALHYASRQKENKRQIIKSLISKNILIVNEQNENGQTPLHLACREGHRENVQMLLQELANFNMDDNEGNNTLHYAAMSEDPETLGFIINKSLAVFKTNKHGQTPLHLACKEGRFKNVKILLDKMPTKWVVDKEGNNALHYAAMSKFSKDIIDVLIDICFNVNAENNGGFTAVHFATKGDNQKTVEYLLQRGASKCTKCQNNENVCK